MKISYFNSRSERESSGKPKFPSIKIITFCLFVLFFLFSVYTVHVYYKYHDTKVVYVNEGLGNQLYKYAFGYIFQKNTGKRVLYKNTINENDERPWVRFWLDRFDIKIIFFKPNKIEKQIIKLFFRKNKRVINMDNYTLDDIFEEGKRNGFKQYYLSYFDAEYFKGYENDIQRMFTTLNSKYAHEIDDRNKKLITEMQSHKNSVVINIRLGDFLRHPCLNVCNFDYYKRAMKVFDKMKDVHYYIFSDDIEGAKKYFKPDKPHTYVDVNPLDKPYLNLILSASAKHNIVSNSTFAIWAGMLNKNPNKIVVCPNENVRFTSDAKEYGYTAETANLSNRIYPKTWTFINTKLDKSIKLNDVDTKFTKNVIKKLDRSVSEVVKKNEIKQSA